MKIEDVDLDRVYYFRYSRKKTLSLLIPISVRKSNLGRNHFWTEAYFYDSLRQQWYYQSGSWTIGNDSYIETNERFTIEEQRLCIKSLLEKGLKQ